MVLLARTRRGPRYYGLELHLQPLRGPTLVKQGEGRATAAHAATF